MSGSGGPPSGVASRLRDGEPVGAVPLHRRAHRLAALPAQVPVVAAFLAAN